MKPFQLRRVGKSLTDSFENPPLPFPSPSLSPPKTTLVLKCQILQVPIVTCIENHNLYVRWRIVWFALRARGIWVGTRLVYPASKSTTTASPRFIRNRLWRYNTLKSIGAYACVYEHSEIPNRHKNVSNICISNTRDPHNLKEGKRRQKYFIRKRIKSLMAS